MSESVQNRGLSLSAVVFLVFLVLKLAEVGAVAHWSWWWVTSPLWISAACMVAVWLFFALLALVAILGQK